MHAYTVGAGLHRRVTRGCLVEKHRRTLTEFGFVQESLCNSPCAARILSTFRSFGRCSATPRSWRVWTLNSLRASSFRSRCATPHVSVRLGVAVRPPRGAVWAMHVRDTRSPVAPVGWVRRGYSVLWWDEADSYRTNNIRRTADSRRGAPSDEPAPLHVMR